MDFSHQHWQIYTFFTINAQLEYYLFGEEYIGKGVI